MNPKGRRYTIACVAVLVCLAGLIQAVIIARAAVPSLDAVRYVGIARAIDKVGFVETFRAEGEQPLFPLAVNLTHGLLSAFVGETPSLWATSAQLAAAVSLVLAVIPVYFISRRLVGVSGGFIAGVFFCVLPEVARLGADGISDAMHLLFFALAFWALLEYFERVLKNSRVAPIGKISGLHIGLAAGMAIGLAVLTRVETIVLLPAILIAALLLRFLGDTRCRWTKSAVFGGGLALGVAVVLGPYLLAVGPNDAGGAAQRVLGRWHPPASDMPTSDMPTGDAGCWQLADGHQIAFGVKEPGTSIRHRGWPAAVLQFGEELADAFGYVIGLLSIVGLWHMRRLRLLRLGPAECLIAVFVVLFSLAGIRFAAAEGYINARHLLRLVVAGIGPSGIGAIALAHWLRQRKMWFSPIRPLPLVVVFFVAICLITTLRPLHAGRIAHRRAGCWLATAERFGVVLDTKGWTGLYSTRTTFQYDRARETFADPRLAYVVVQREDLQTTSGRGRTLRFLLDTAAEPAATFAGHGGRGAVTVYRWYHERFREKIAACRAPASYKRAQILINKGDT